MATVIPIATPPAQQRNDCECGEDCPLGCLHDADPAGTTRCMALDVDAAAICRLAAATHPGRARPHGGTKFAAS